MAFKGLRFAGLEWKNITASKIMWVVIAAIAIMPLLYGALYLAAFQDPYARLNEVPVAVVNEDQGALISNKQKNVGNDVVGELKNNSDGLQWNFVSAEEAKKGLVDGTYFMTCTIPVDFSKSIASVEGAVPVHAQLKIVYNQSENMLASQIGETVWKEVRAKVSTTAAHEYWVTVLGRVSDSGKEIQRASDGAEDIAAGILTAKDGSQTISDNLGVLTNGATTLESGLGELSCGASSLNDGSVALEEGALALSQGLGSLKGQTSALPSQASSLNSGVQSVVGSMNDLVIGLGSDADSSTLIGGSYVLSQGLLQVSQGTAQVKGGIDQVVGGLGQAITSTADLQKLAQAAQSGDEAAMRQALAQISAGLGTPSAPGTVVSSMTYLQTSLTTISGDVAQGTGLASLGDASSQLSAGAATMQGGLVGVRDSIVAKSSDLDALSAGASQLAAAAPMLSGTVDQLSGGANRLDAGTAQLSLGASRLADGTTDAQAGATQLSSGAAQLKDGSSTLTSGLADAVDGSSELSTKLAKGAQSADSQVSNSATRADVMSDPIELANEYYTTVKNYGTGFAPYFMALGLWVGGLVAGFVFKPLNNRLILSGGNPIMVAFANYLPVAVFSLLQAGLLMVVLQFGLQLQIDNVAAFYAMGALTALVFASIMQFLMAAFGFLGKFAAIILLMLQLTACAGTFPIQTTPPFFQAINPFMPMTYVVSGLRQIMTGLDFTVVVLDCFVLFCIGAACFALTCVVAYRKRTVRMDDLHPVLELG